MRTSRTETAVIDADYEWTIVKAHTDKGIVGWGEAFFAPGLTAAPREFSEFLVGEPPRDVNHLTRLMRTALGMSVLFLDDPLQGRGRPLAQKGCVQVSDRLGMGAELSAKPSLTDFASRGKNSPGFGTRD